MGAQFCGLKSLSHQASGSVTSDFGSMTVLDLTAEFYCGQIAAIKVKGKRDSKINFILAASMADGTQSVRSEACAFHEASAASRMQHSFRVNAT